MKKLLLTLSAIVTASALAQPAPAVNTGQQGSTTPAAANPATPPVAPPSKSTDALPEGNPFNGKPLTTQELRRELELSRAQVDAIEQRLMANMSPEELKAYLAKKAPAKESGDVKGDSKSSKESAKPAKTANASPTQGAAVGAEAASTPKRPATKRAAKKTVKPAPVVVEDASESNFRPVLTSIISVGRTFSVVFEVHGRSYMAYDGEETPFGKLVVWDESCVDLGGTRLRVETR